MAVMHSIALQQQGDGVLHSDVTAPDHVLNLICDHCTKLMIEGNLVESTASQLF